MSKGIQRLFGKIGFNGLIQKAGIGELTRKSQIGVGDILVELVHYEVGMQGHG